jgi:hypothetical protein
VKFATVRIENSRRQFEQLTAHSVSDQRKKTCCALQVPVRDLTERRTGIVDVYRLDIIRIIVEPFLDLIIPGGRFELARHDC